MLASRKFCRLFQKKLLLSNQTDCGTKRFNHPEVYFSGIQPTGVPHLGNYFGLIEQWLNIQKKAPPSSSLYLSVVDYHSLSSGPVNPLKMKQNILSMAASLLACGVDPNRTVLFQQSDVLEHTNLMFVFGMLQTVSQLKKLTQYKEKSAKFKAGNIPLNLLAYPVLQTADILLYKGTHVPVGEDQTQHLRLSRDIADLFNNIFQIDFFPIPKQITTVNKRIKSLREPGKKMSKSDPTSLSRIDITDSREAIFEKCSRALSDFQSNVTYEPETRPAVSNLVSLYCAVNNKQPEEAVTELETFDTKAFKHKLADDIDQMIMPIRQKYEELLRNPAVVVDALSEGTRKARMVSQKTMSEVKEILGFKL